MKYQDPSERIQSLFGHLQQVERARSVNRELFEGVVDDSATTSVLAALEEQAGKLDHAAAQIVRAIEEEGGSGPDAVDVLI